MIFTQFIGVGMLLAFVLLICFGLGFFLHTKNEFHAPPILVPFFLITHGLAFRLLLQRDGAGISQTQPT
jgi:hypothetical protein